MIGAQGDCYGLFHGVSRNAEPGVPQPVRYCLRSNYQRPWIEMTLPERVKLSRCQAVSLQLVTWSVRQADMVREEKTGLSPPGRELLDLTMKCDCNFSCCHGAALCSGLEGQEIHFPGGSLHTPQWLHQYLSSPASV